MVRDKVEIVSDVLRACDKRTVTEITKMAVIGSKTAKTVLDLMKIKGYVTVERTREIARPGEEIELGVLRDRYTITHAGSLFLGEIDRLLKEITP